MHSAAKAASAALTPAPLPHLLKLRLRLAPAEVGQRPGGVAQHGHLGVVLQLLHQRVQRAVAQHQVAALGRVARNVAQRPDRLRGGAQRAVSAASELGAAPSTQCIYCTVLACSPPLGYGAQPWPAARWLPSAPHPCAAPTGWTHLLPHIVNGRLQQLHKDGHCPRLNDHARVVRGARRHVGQRPGGLKLQRGGTGGMPCTSQGWPLRCCKTRQRTSCTPWHARPSYTVHPAPAAAAAPPTKLSACPAKPRLRCYALGLGPHLQRRRVGALQELHKAGDDALADDLLDRRVALCGERAAAPASERSAARSHQASAWHACTAALLCRVCHSHRVSFCTSRRCLRATLRHPNQHTPIDSSLRNWVVASSCACGSSDHTPCTMAGRLSSCRRTGTGGGWGEFGWGRRLSAAKPGTAVCADGSGCNRGLLSPKKLRTRARPSPAPSAPGRAHLLLHHRPRRVQLARRHHGTDHALLLQVLIPPVLTQLHNIVLALLLGLLQVDACGAAAGARAATGWHVACSAGRLVRQPRPLAASGTGCLPRCRPRSRCAGPLASRHAGHERPPGLPRQPRSHRPGNQRRALQPSCVRRTGPARQVGAHHPPFLIVALPLEPGRSDMAAKVLGARCQSAGEGLLAGIAASVIRRSCRGRLGSQGVGGNDQGESHGGSSRFEWARAGARKFGAEEAPTAGVLLWFRGLTITPPFEQSEYMSSEEGWRCRAASRRRQVQAGVACCPALWGWAVPFTAAQPSLLVNHLLGVPARRPQRHFGLSATCAATRLGTRAGLMQPAAEW